MVEKREEKKLDRPGIWTFILKTNSQWLMLSGANC